MSHFSSRLFRTLGAVILLAGIAATGCATWDLQGRGFGTPDATWGEDLRPTSDAGRSFGLDTRAREIERSLGVH